MRNSRTETMLDGLEARLARWLGRPPSARRTDAIARLARRGELLARRFAGRERLWHRAALLAHSARDAP